MDKLEFKQAVRRAVPILMSISSVSGGGKTYSALLIAAGLAGPSGKVGFIDTENGRGGMYADSPGIVRALPKGFDILQLDPPFTPRRYIECVKAAEEAGMTVCVVDSGTHEWEGTGGCCEMAEEKKLRGMPNWGLAKTEHKRFVNCLLSSNMHLIVCLRARDKVKIEKVKKTRNGQQIEEMEVVPIGLQPICEKNFVFEMLVSLQLDEKSHFASPLKVPEPLAPLFTGARLLTKEDGDRIREWNNTGGAADPVERLKQRARLAAQTGIEGYREFFAALPPNQKKVLTDSIHEELKFDAEEITKAAKGAEAETFTTA